MKSKDFKWFETQGKKGELFSSAKNIEEKKHRLKWLSEGSLEYHLTKFQSDPPPCQKEINLYHAFVEQL